MCRLAVEGYLTGQTSGPPTVQKERQGHIHVYLFGLFVPGNEMSGTLLLMADQCFPGSCSRLSYSLCFGGGRRLLLATVGQLSL